MPMMAANLASPPTAPAPAAALAAAALASRRADPAVRGRVMVRRPLLPKAVLITQLADPAPPAGVGAGVASSGHPTAPLVQLPVGMCCQPRLAASTAALVPLADDLTPDCVEEFIPKSSLPEQRLPSEINDTINASGSSNSPKSNSAVHGEMGSGLASFSTTSLSHACSLPAAADGRDGAGHEEAPWELVQPRRGLRRTALVSPSLKTRPPPPAWLNGRCHCCHEAGHWASTCRERVKCNNCLQFGHKAKCCTGRTAPRPPPVQHRRPSHAPTVVCPRPRQRPPLGPVQQPKPPCELTDVQLQSVLAEQAELLRSELQGCLARVESFLVRAEAALGRPLVVRGVSPPSELHVNFANDGEACLYGNFSPRAKPSSSSLPIEHAASKSKDMNGVMTSVMQIMPELQEICGETASLKMVSIGNPAVVDITDVVPDLQELCREPSVVMLKEMGPLGISVVTVTPSPPLLVVSSSGEIGEVGASTLDSETLFAKELSDLLISLESACPGGGKEIVDILTAKDSRDIIKKVKKSLRSKCKKSAMTRKASAAA